MGREFAASFSLHMLTAYLEKLRRASDTRLRLVSVDAASRRSLFIFFLLSHSLGTVSPLSRGSQQLAATGERDTRRSSPHSISAVLVNGQLSTKSLLL